MTWIKENIVDGVHSLEFPPVNKLTGQGWIINYNLSPEAMTADGFTQWTDEQLAAWHEQYDPKPEPHIKRRCTKYQLVSCLMNHFPELRDALRENYKNNADLQFFWNTVNDLDRDDQIFQNFVRQLGITDEQLDAIFEKIEGEEPTALTTAQ